MQPPGFLPSKSDPWLTMTSAQTRNVSQENTVPQTDVPADCGNEQSQKGKRDADESMSSVQQKIDALRANLAALEHEHEMQKLCRTACK
jgi:hypothetical protein